MTGEALRREWPARDRELTRREFDVLRLLVVTGLVSLIGTPAAMLRGSENLPSRHADSGNDFEGVHWTKRMNSGPCP